MHVTAGYCHWKGGRPQLYLDTFSREQRGLVGLDHQIHQPAHAALFERLTHEDRRDLSSGVKFVGSGRHTAYVEVSDYREYLCKLSGRLGRDSLSPRDVRRRTHHVGLEGGPPL
ncbi:hypothetical protein [Streptomyces sp. NBC_00459]|uniref:hypothetical protein n=1 Tax=Streptomyces sp. NBC_00459 TaxID=2975749 RepID=UPI002E19CDB6